MRLCCHPALQNISQKDLHEAVMERSSNRFLPVEWLDPTTKYFINPTGRFVALSGPMGDCGLTGPKSSSIPLAAWRHGGGAFSDK